MKAERSQHYLIWYQLGMYTLRKSKKKFTLCMSTKTTGKSSGWQVWGFARNLVSRQKYTVCEYGTTNSEVEGR